MAKKVWVVVADGGGARILSGKDTFRYRGLETVIELEFENKPSRELGSDKPGRTFDRSGLGRHAKEEPTDPHRHQQDVFAAEIVSLLDQKRKEGVFETLTIVAPPRMLGDIRAHMPTDLARMVELELNKDLTKVAISDLPGHLSEFERS